jgi:HAD superfamily hydrolase (TIGR01450 family)
MNKPAPPTISIRSLADRYDALLIDAYGVLVDGSGAIPGAVEAINDLNACEKMWLVVTNDASRHPETSAAGYAKFGLDIAPSRILTSGSLLAGWFARHGLAGAGTTVLGPEDSLRYAREAGGDILPHGDDRAGVVVVADDAGFPFLEAIEGVISALFRRIDRGETVHLVLPNPDLIYPKGPGEFGITAGSIALVIEAALAQRYPSRDDLTFERLGKPFPAIYEKAIERLGTRRLCMVGDQLATDVLGAQMAGLDSALVTGGVGVFDPAGPIRPDWLVTM